MKTVINQWDNAAQKYTEDQECSSYVVFNKDFVKLRFKKFNGEEILDLGCGYGFYTDYFRNIGAKVVGVDASKNMIKIAKKRYPLTEYDVMDITKPFSFENNQFDVIFCNQVLMDVENLETIFSECRRILKPGGLLYYSIVHPAFYGSKWIKDENGYKYAKLIDKYLKQYQINNDFWGETAHFHRPLSYYFNLASNNGFHLIKIDEPFVYEKNNRDIPLFLFAEYKKCN